MLSKAFLVTSILAVVQLASAQSPLWGQCGGIGWSGPTVCAQGTCTKLNDWHYQCLPDSSSSSLTSTTRSSTTSTSSSSGSTSTGLSHCGYD
ncbi:hypothetical protein CPB86DRAFT_792172 [Serendipita vermifera]|nr:hypothetical protein CPB86DRAFT_792172 [Serendipita vermifera]